MSPNPDFDDNPTPLGREAEIPSEPGPPPVARAARAAAPQPGPPAAESGPVNVLFLGPPASGKTETIAAGQSACLAVHDPSLQCRFTYTGEFGDLIQRRRERLGVRQPNDATAGTAEHRFGLELVQRTADLTEPRLLDACSACLLDGPGGAGFPKDGQVGPLSADMLEYRRLLLATGRTARALVFFVNVMTERDERCVAANITRLLGDLAVLTNVTVQGAHGNGTGRRWNPFGRRVPEAPPEVRSVPKINAERLLFVLNHVDQLAVAWKQHWWVQGDPRAGLSPLEIARQEIRPARLAFEVLGRDLLLEVESFLKPGAQLATAVCSATGFVKGTGDPFCNADGTLNSQLGIPAQAMLERQILYGVRESLQFAAFGVAVPRVVERLSYTDFVSDRKGRE